MKKNKFFALLLALCALPMWAEGVLQVIPRPAVCQEGDGTFVFSKKVNVYTDAYPGDSIRLVFNRFAQKLQAAAGVQCKEAEAGKAALLLKLNSQLGPEAYTLQVTPKQVCIEAARPAGFFYALQTLQQLLPTRAVLAGQPVAKGTQLTLPAVSISDEPRCGWRGFMLDEGRHFFGKDEIKKLLDVMAAYKLNRFHWHLTEDQGWRIEIKKYPRLTQVGSKRDNGDGTIYDGFYTQAQIKDIVAYAAERFVTIVPEIEVPRHELAAIAAYPELSCKGERVEPRKTWGVEDIVMCPGKETMFNFLEDVVAEVAPLFPGKYFHIGGDECPKRSWKECPRCQARIKAEGLEADGKHTAEERLQSYVISRMENILAKHGKSIIGWDEILEGGLSPNATVM